MPCRLLTVTVLNIVGSAIASVRRCASGDRDRPSRHQLDAPKRGLDSAPHWRFALQLEDSPLLTLKPGTLLSRRAPHTMPQSDCCPLLRAIAGCRPVTWIVSGTDKTTHCEADVKY